MRLPEDKITYIDRPEVSEIFSDSLGLCNFHDNMALVEFCITRFNKINPPNHPTGRKFPVARLVLTPEAVVDLFRFTQNMMAIMQKEGVIKVEPIPKVAQQH